MQPWSSPETKRGRYRALELVAAVLLDVLRHAGLEPDDGHEARVGARDHLEVGAVDERGQTVAAVLRAQRPGRRGPPRGASRSRRRCAAERRPGRSRAAPPRASGRAPRPRCPRRSRRRCGGWSCRSRPPRRRSPRRRAEPEVARPVDAVVDEQLDVPVEEFLRHDAERHSTSWRREITIRRDVLRGPVPPGTIAPCRSFPTSTSTSSGSPPGSWASRSSASASPSPFLLRSVEPPISSVEGRRVTGLRRLGKRIVIGLEDELFLVLHLMIAGRLRWRPVGTRVPGKLGLAAFDFPTGTLLLTEASTKKRASLHVVRGETGLAAHDPGGIEVLDADLASFRAALVRESHTLKRALTDPRLLTGIGNAYSDEILHRARLSPVRLTRQLDDAEMERLWRATRETLEEWTREAPRRGGRRLPREGDGLPTRHGRARALPPALPRLRRARAAHRLRGERDQLLRALPDRGRSPRRPLPLAPPQGGLADERWRRSRRSGPRSRRARLAALAGASTLSGARRARARRPRARARGRPASAGESRGRG